MFPSVNAWLKITEKYLSHSETITKNLEMSEEGLLVIARLRSVRPFDFWVRSNPGLESRVLSLLYANLNFTVNTSLDKSLMRWAIL